MRRNEKKANSYKFLNSFRSRTSQTVYPHLVRLDSAYMAEQPLRIIILLFIYSYKLHFCKGIAGT